MRDDLTSKVGSDWQDDTRTTAAGDRGKHQGIGHVCCRLETLTFAISPSLLMNQALQLLGYQQGFPAPSA